MAIDLLDFGWNVRQLAKQALGKDAGKPESGGFPRWVHVVIHCIRVQEKYTFSEVINRFSLMPGMCELFGLIPEALPDPSALWYSFQRFKMWVWRQRLRRGAQQLGGSGHVALDSTFFDRGHASTYLRHRSDRNIQTLKVTTLTDVESVAVLSLQYLAQWRNDTKVGSQVVRRNADDQLSVAADKAFQNWPSQFEYYTLDVDPLILQRGSTPLTVGHNAVIQEKGSTQRWMAETSYSALKRSLGDAVRAREWCREFREIVLMFAVYNIEQLSETL